LPIQASFDKKQQQNFVNINNQDSIKSNAEINEKNNLILEKINYNLIHEETIYQASNSMKKLMEAKNLVNNIGNFARDETLTKIAINLMEPKLEKWLNENLPLMVENIVREEIEKIVPKV
jgi:cell pole-organizing protein PopZ